MKKILLTSVGSLAGLSILQCLKDIHREILVIGTNTDPVPAHMYDCDKLYLVEKTSDASNFEKALKKILDMERPDLIIPCRDEEIEVLGKISEEPEYADSIFLAPKKGLGSVFNDKYETWKFSKIHNLPFAHSAYSEMEVLDLFQEKGFPLIAKPRFCGHASKDVYIVTNKTELNNLIKKESFVIQELLNPATLGNQIEPLPALGKPWSVTISDQRFAAETIIDKNGRIISLSTVESDTNGPLSVRMSAIDNPRMTLVAEAWAAQLAKAGHFGVLNLQGKLLKNGDFIPFELNARFTGSAVARKYLGYNQVEHAVEHFLFKKQGWPRHHGDNSVTVSRTPYYVTAKTKNIETLALNKEWSANSSSLEKEN